MLEDVTVTVEFRELFSRGNVNFRPPEQLFDPAYVSSLLYASHKVYVRARLTMGDCYITTATASNDYGLPQVIDVDAYGVPCDASNAAWAVYAAPE